MRSLLLTLPILALPLALLGCKDGDGDGDGDDTALVDSDCPDEGDEICNGIDDNGNGLIDEGLLEIFWVDADGDGYGDPLNPIQACEAGDGIVDNGSDCDDGDAAVYPGADDPPYDGIDGDCDGVDIDDVDGDGFANDVDCDDEDPSVYPGAEEICLDGADNDCDGIDESCTTDDMVGVAGHAGLRAVAAKDVDNDGIDDLLLGYAGATFEDHYSGGAVLVKGPITSNITAQTESSVILKLDGGYGTYVGQSVGIGDVDADGDEDLVAGILGYTDDLFRAGGFAVTEASATGFVGLETEATAFWRGPGAEDRQGHDMQVEDIDGDGQADVLISGYGGGTSPRATAYLVTDVGTGAHLLTEATAIFRGDLVGEIALNIDNGSRIHSADMDGDGIHDLVMGSSLDDQNAESSGAAWIFTGPFVGDFAATDATATIYGSAASDELGIDVALGDFDGDGLREAWIGSHKGEGVEANAGAVYLYTSSATGILDEGDASASLLGLLAGDRAGFSLHARDLDGDGDDELVVGAPGEDSTEDAAGAVYVLMDPPATGATSLADANTTVYGGENLSTWGMQNGESLGSGDVDGDGVIDLLMNARDAHPSLIGDGTSRGGVTWIGYGSW